ncbi:SPOSA6832_03569 [Sporobolomyces salmonicolor]|uniref:SPOSA6832_03569-mRNA-1:cds n=1 Tax=Sporidiobolus salmonicolor TaxID=5005 RepID=A0A0D6EPU5_SPOSA|nr:SPOSA6832_03569 [Sporobolomyces salmonicolor]
MFSSLRTSLLRQAPRHQLRHASSSSTSEQAAQKAKDASDKAKQIAGQATQRASQLFGNISQKAGDALGSYKEPIFYNAAVAKEFAKQVYQAEKLGPPSLAQASYTYQQFFRQAPQFSFWQKLYESGEYKRWLLYAVEAYGIFSIGEMIGRRHIVG